MTPLVRMRMSFKSAATAAAAAATARPLPRAAAAAAPAARGFSSDDSLQHKSLVTHEEGVHQTMKVSKTWRNKPLFRRQGDVRFKTGMEAANLLVREAKRRDDHEIEYIDSVTTYRYYFFLFLLLTVIITLQIILC